MRLRIYVEGRPSWQDLGPSQARLPGHRGALVTPIERPPSKATLDTSRRYRAAHPDRIQAYQRDYRARVKAEVIELREGRAS